MLRKLFGRDPKKEAAASLYAHAVSAARQPFLYDRFLVPDTLDGRYEMIALHVYVILRRLKAAGGRGKPLAQMLFDTMFDNMDRTLREMGAGDLGVGRRVKAMAQAFYGRIAAYDAGLSGTVTDGLETALARNVYRQSGAGAEMPVKELAAYLAALAAKLDIHDIAMLERGSVEFSAGGEGEGADERR